MPPNATSLIAQVKSDIAQAERHLEDAITVLGPGASDTTVRALRDELRGIAKRLHDFRTRS